MKKKIEFTGSNHALLRPCNVLIFQKDLAEALIKIFAALLLLKNVSRGVRRKTEGKLYRTQDLRQDSYAMK